MTSEAKSEQVIGTVLKQNTVCWALLAAFWSLIGVSLGAKSRTTTYLVFMLALTGQVGLGCTLMIFLRRVYFRKISISSLITPILMCSLPVFTMVYFPLKRLPYREWNVILLLVAVPIGLLLGLLTFSFVLRRRNILTMKETVLNIVSWCIACSACIFLAVGLEILFKFQNYGISLGFGGLLFLALGVLALQKIVKLEPNS